MAVWVLVSACADERPNFEQPEGPAHADSQGTDSPDASEGESQSDVSSNPHTDNDDGSDAETETESSDTDTTDGDTGASDGSSDDDETDKCSRYSDCSGGTQCLEVDCVDGHCQEIVTRRGTSCDDGVCDGDGECVECLANADCPAQECSESVCDDNECVPEHSAEGTPCGSSDELICDGDGGCVGCLGASDCGEAPRCSTYSCDADGQCQLEPQEAGAVAGEGSAEDCRVKQCDGSGGTELLPDDVACDDELFCNGQEVCRADGTCSAAEETPCAGNDAGPRCDDSCDEEALACTAPDARGTECSDGFCDGSGECIECLDADDCGEQSPFCHEGECVECLETEDCETSDCWDASCVDLKCESTAAEIGTACGRNGGLLCDGAGTCAGCVEAEDCGDPPLCNLYTCTSDGDCLLEPSTAGPIAESTQADDCRVRECDGMGSELSVTDSSLCDDGQFCNGQEVCNEDGTCSPAAAPPCAVDDPTSCTDACDEAADACTALAAPGTACAGGTCDGSGDCVACRTNDDCAEATPFCSSSGACVECLNATHCSSDSGECFGAQVCNADGQCEDQFAAEGASCTTVGATPCTVPACDGAGRCVATNVAATTPCDDDDSCTLASECDGSGECVGTVQTCPGEGQVCSEGICSCTTGYRTCDGGCIEDDPAVCCEHADCGSGGSCVASACECAEGFTHCDLTDSCIPDGKCCTDDDCGSGQVCPTAGGNCACPENGFGLYTLIEEPSAPETCQPYQYFREGASSPFCGSDGGLITYRSCNTSTCAWTTTTTECCTDNGTCPWL